MSDAVLIIKAKDVVQARIAAKRYDLELVSCCTTHHKGEVLGFVRHGFSDASFKQRIYAWFNEIGIRDEGEKPKLPQGTLLWFTDVRERKET